MCPYAASGGGSAVGLAFMIVPLVVFALVLGGQWLFHKLQTPKLTESEIQPVNAFVSATDILAEAETIVERAWALPLPAEEVADEPTTDNVKL